MSELRLQSDIAREFSVRYPFKKGQLLHISNERNNKIQAFQARSIGIIPGASDFLYFEKEHDINCLGVVFVAIEIKEPGSRHQVYQIERQVEWGELVEKVGGVWRLCRSVEEAISCTQLNFKGLTTQEVRDLLKSVKTKSVKL